MSVANPNSPSQQSGPTLLRDSDVPQTHKRIPEQGERQTLDPDGRRLRLFDMSPKEPHSNQVASALMAVPPRRNDTYLTLSPAATAEMDDVLLVGGEVASSSTAADAPAETASAIRALTALTETSLLAAQQSNDILPKQIIMSGVD